MRLNSPQINLITRACMKASRSLIRDFGEIENLQVSSKGPGDFVSSADKRTEKIIIDELQKAHPDYGIVTEESGFINKSNKKNRWIIDPIDGTSNFLHGIPHFAISIGLEQDQEIICGIIYDPIKDEMFTAEKGNGSYINNHRMRVSSRSKLKDCMIFTGGPKYDSTDKDISMKEYNKFSSEIFTPIRKLGSGSLDMAYVAAGRCDGFFSRNLSYWDIAAGIILVKEAGGFVTDFNGGNEYIQNKTMVASNAKINKEMTDILDV